MSEKITIRPVNEHDTILIRELIKKNWGGEPLVVRGKNYYPSSLPEILAVTDDSVEGFLIYEIENGECQIVVFEVFHKFLGLGTKLFEALKTILKEKNCHKITLMTTNDNLDALRFYQRRGFVITGIHLNSMKLSRQMKPAIPEIGDYG